MDFDYDPSTFATTHLLEDVIGDYPEMLSNPSKELAAVQYMRLELLGEFDSPMEKNDDATDYNE
jgi:hypothetical protein